MIKSLGTEFKVGVFVLVALGTLGYMFFVLSPDYFENKDYKSYYTVLRNAAGIISKTHVKTSGVSIGKVKSVALDGVTTRVILEIDSKVPIPVGSKLEIRSVGLLGDVHLEVTRPANATTLVEENGFIPQNEDSMDMQSMIALAGDILKDVKKVTTTLANSLGNDKAEVSIENIVSNIEALTADLKATTSSLRSVVGNRETDLNDIVSNVRDGARDLRSFAGNLNSVLDQNNRERIDRILTSFDETMVDVKSSAKNISLISDKVEKGEGTFGKLINDDAAIKELEGAIKDIRKVLAPATRLSVEVDTHAEYRRNKTSQVYFNLVFKTRPDRWYLLGLTDTTYDRKETETIDAENDVDDDGKPRRLTRERIKEEHALKFNLQMAKRWYWAALRFGLFETTGGVAADFFLWGDRIRLSAEAFDFDSNDTSIRRNFHLKTYASVLFYNHVYAVAGVDDWTRTDPNTKKADRRPNWFVGAGLTFTDQDLKAIFGTAALVAR